MSTQSDDYNYFDQNLNVLASDDAMQNMNSYEKGKAQQDGSDLAALHTSMDTAIQQHHTLATLVLYANSLANSEMQMNEKLKHEQSVLSDVDRKIVNNIYTIRSRYYDKYARAYFDQLFINIMKVTIVAIVAVLIIVMAALKGAISMIAHYILVAIVVLIYVIYFYQRLSLYWRRDRTDPTRIVFTGRKDTGSDGTCN